MSTTPAREQLFDSAASYLRHLGGVLDGVGDDKYTQESHALPGSTIGKHVRHVLDHFSLLLAALEGADPQQTGPLGVVDYAHRERSPATESTVAGGRAAIERVIADMARVRALPLPPGGWICVCDTLPGGAEGRYESSVDRELWFCLHHMVHHNAIIAGLMHELGLDPPTEFAYAPSTIKHSS
ncbi:hypothetical protein H4R18_004425 [Coemansia javaensis]|uniref:DinB-like domain-containing protein n=1 Tax=Coemansia javaensis TaxID=2761396 RepID=A0A9W8LG99_9FUNG|nr:hypothetical protein H4R18_004425 [Coemansia javaensis]